MAITKPAITNLKFNIVEWIKYCWHSDSIYNTHSPFLYNLAENVLTNNSAQSNIYKPVKKLYSALKKDKSIISINDLGAGSTIFKSEQRSISQLTRTTALPLKYGTLFHRLVQWSGARNILELGTGLGISTVYFALSQNPGLKVNTIEGSDNLIAEAKKNISSLKLEPKVNFYKGDFDNVLSKVLTEIGKVDIVFMDGNHKKEASLRYFRQILPYLHNNSILIMDDIRWSEKMLEAWDAIRTHSSVTCSVDLFRMGLIFFRKELLKPQHISFKY